jgi:RNA polymerase sigma factor (sigma-70 family)
MNISRELTEKLAKGCLNNERKAQEELYLLFHADMQRVCYSYLPDDMLVREALNAGFLKVFQSIGTFDIQKGELGGWIRKIMIHTTIDLYRKELKFSPVNEHTLSEDEFFISPAVLTQLYFKDILAEIRRLPYATQTVFNLSVLDGYSHKEIGEKLNISEGTSRWHLAEAKRRLRELLNAEDQSTDQTKGRRDNAQ